MTVEAEVLIKHTVCERLTAEVTFLSERNAKVIMPASKGVHKEC